jgi:hypothetical protein
MNEFNKGRSNPIEFWERRWGSRMLRLPEHMDNRHMKVKRLSQCQPYVPAVFTHQKISLLLISVRGRVDSRVTMWR